MSVDPATGVAYGKIAVAFCNGSEDTPQFVGPIVGYYSQPTLLIYRNGHAEAWAAELVREATPEEAIAYWRERALKAEGTPPPEAGAEG